MDFVKLIPSQKEDSFAKKKSFELKFLSPNESSSPRSITHFLYNTSMGFIIYIIF